MKVLINCVRMKRIKGDKSDVSVHLLQPQEGRAPLTLRKTDYMLEMLWGGEQRLHPGSA